MMKNLILLSLITFINCTHMPTENLHLQTGEIYKMTLPSRGATGLQLLFRVTDDSIVDIKRIESSGNENDSTAPRSIGGPVQATFEITALKPGETNVTFYETRPWEKDFKEIIVQNLTIEVD